MKRDIKIVGFVCKFCALLSFDLGPDSETEASVELVELPCAGRIDVRAILAAFERGADGVFVAGCPTHECLNLSGSLRAEKRVNRVKELLDEVGLGRERLVLYRVSGTQGPRQAEIIQEMVANTKTTGLNPLKI